MKRVEGAERGAGEFERITWDEAIDEIARRWKSYCDEFGSESIAVVSGSGNYHLASGVALGASGIQRFKTPSCSSLRAFWPAGTWRCIWSPTRRGSAGRWGGECARRSGGGTRAARAPARARRDLFRLRGAPYAHGELEASAAVGLRVLRAGVRAPDAHARAGREPRWRVWPCARWSSAPTPCCACAGRLSTAALLQRSVPRMLHRASISRPGTAPSS